MRAQMPFDAGVCSCGESRVLYLASKESGASRWKYEQIMSGNLDRLCRNTVADSSNASLDYGMGKQLSPVPSGLATQDPTSLHDIAYFFDGKYALCIEDFLGAEELKAHVASIFAAKEAGEWTNWNNKQYSLGEAWYTYAEGFAPLQRFEEYARLVPRSRLLVEQRLPGLEAKVMALLRVLVGPKHTVTERKGWAGPGVVIFPPGRVVAREGGAPHFDIDSFTHQELREGVVMLSAVCMLQKPVAGGDLYLWDLQYDPCKPRNQFETEFASAECLSPDIRLMRKEVKYSPGDLWLFNGLQLHQIQAFAGLKERMCLTFHLFLSADSCWQVWM
jgi:hypothetical protein